MAASLLAGGCNRTEPAKAPATATAAAPAEAPKTASSAASTGTSATPATSTSSPRRSTAESDRERFRQSMEQVPVETAPVTRGPISAFLAFNSTLETEAAVDLYPLTNGQVELLFVEEGQIVKQGDPLLKIEDRELRVDVEESTANYEQLTRNFGRTQDLFERNLINKQDFENQAYQLEQARLRLERAKIRLSYVTVRAPFDGVISARDTQVGARVTNGTKVFSMVKLDEIVARVFVPGRYLAVVSEDQPAIIASEFLPDRSFEGWVKRISPVVDPKSGTFRVTVGVHTDNPALALGAAATGEVRSAAPRVELRPGLFVSVRVITDTRPQALLIPKRAVVYEGGERYAFTIVNGRASKRKLAVGYEDPTRIEVVSGFDVGMPIIVLGQNGLKDGAAVRVVNALTPIPQPAEEEPNLDAPKTTIANTAERDARKS
jgi:membrane fusion protein, multidrug efflux system